MYECVTCSPEPEREPRRPLKCQHQRDKPVASEGLEENSLTQKSEKRKKQRCLRCFHQWMFVKQGRFRLWLISGLMCFSASWSQRPTVEETLCNPLGTVATCSVAEDRPGGGGGGGGGGCFFFFFFVRAFAFFLCFFFFFILF